MDHDAMLRDVQGLKNFRSRVESAIAYIEGLKTAGFKPSGDAAGGLDLSDQQKSQIRDLFAEIIKPVSDAIDNKLNSFDDRIKSAEKSVGGASDTSGISQRLSALEQVKIDSDGQYDRLEQMLTWFEANKEGMELLLSLDGDVDQPELIPEHGSAEASTLTGTANAGAGDVTGAGDGLPGTTGTGDPSVRAETAVAEPVAKP